MYFIYWEGNCGENRYSGPYESDIAAYDEATKNKKLPVFYILRKTMHVVSSLTYTRLSYHDNDNVPTEQCLSKPTL